MSFPFHFQVSAYRKITEREAERPLIVERDQLIGAGRWLPGEDAVGVAGAEKRFVGEPVQFSYAAAISLAPRVCLTELLFCHNGNTIHQ
jgi:hypothetical protein